MSLRDGSCQRSSGHLTHARPHRQFGCIFFAPQALDEPDETDGRRRGHDDAVRQEVGGGCQKRQKGPPRSRLRDESFAEKPVHQAEDPGFVLPVKPVRDVMKPADRHQPVSAEGDVSRQQKRETVENRPLENGRSSYEIRYHRALYLLSRTGSGA